MAWVAYQRLLTAHNLVHVWSSHSHEVCCHIQMFSCTLNVPGMCIGSVVGYNSYHSSNIPEYINLIHIALVSCLLHVMMVPCPKTILALKMYVIITNGELILPLLQMYH